MGYGEWLEPLRSSERRTDLAKPEPEENWAFGPVSPAAHRYAPRSSPPPIAQPPSTAEALALQERL